MKRFVRLTGLFLCAAVAVAATLVVLFLFQPGWQTESARKLLAQDSDRQWDLGSLSLSSQGVEVEDLFILDRSGGLEVGTLSLELDWFSLLTGSISVRSGTVTRAFIDLSEIPIDANVRYHLIRAKEDPGELLAWMEAKIEDLLRASGGNLPKLKIRKVKVDAYLLFREEFRFPIQFEIEDIRLEEAETVVELSLL
jgi:hypothetical protein